MTVEAGMRNAARTVDVVCCVDDGYAMPLAAMIRSAVDGLRVGWRIRLHVVDLGLAAESRLRLRRSWPEAAVELHFHEARWKLIEGAAAGKVYGPVHYMGLTLPETLPAGLERVVFLDADMIVRRDLVDLWEVPLDGLLLAAVPDPGGPRMDACTAPHLRILVERGKVRRHPAPNYQELGISGEQPYFGFGVLLLDLARCRREAVFPQARDVLCKYAGADWCHNEFALNTIAAGRWKVLDPRWNRLSWTADAAADDTPFRDSPAFWKVLRDDPWIVHFVGVRKPWQYGSPPAEAKWFYPALDRTDWAGWRPPRTWARWWTRRAAAARRIGARLLGRRPAA